jgi:membrane fusion protein
VRALFGLERQTQWLGPVLQAPRWSHPLFALFAAASLAGLLGLLCGGHYTRRARICGWLVPRPAPLQLFPPQLGVVTQLDVREGVEVKKGDRLLVLATELPSTRLGKSQAEAVRRLLARRASLVDDQQRLAELRAQQLRALGEQLQALRVERAQLGAEIALQRSVLRLGAGADERQENVAAQVARLEQSEKLRALERARAASERERLSVVATLEELPLQSESAMSSVARALARVEHELAQTEARRELAVVAPESGTVSNVQVERGGRTNPTAPLLSIVPAGAVLEAHLFGPSRAVGFVRAGQRLLLRYPAYPKLGLQEGVVTQIARAAATSARLPPQIASTRRGADEPIDRIRVELSRQTVSSFGQKISLQAGMMIEADIVVERRRLIAWVLEPLAAISRKWKP